MSTEVAVLVSMVLIRLFAVHPKRFADKPTNTLFKAQWLTKAKSASFVAYAPTQCHDIVIVTETWQDDNMSWIQEEKQDRSRNYGASLCVHVSTHNKGFRMFREMLLASEM